jgi:hypothetical protein
MQERRWRAQLAQWNANDEWPDFDAYKGDGPVEMKLLTRGDMYAAACFVNTLRLRNVARRILDRAHTKVAWPLRIEIDTHLPWQTDDESCALMHVEKDDFQPRYIEDWSASDRDWVDDAKSEYNESTESPAAHALISVALTRQESGVRSSVRLLSCILPQCTVVVGPSGRYVLEEPGEYRVCHPLYQHTLMEGESKLDFMIDEDDKSSNISAESEIEIDGMTDRNVVPDDEHIKRDKECQTSNVTMSIQALGDENQINDDHGFGISVMSDARVPVAVNDQGKVKLEPQNITHYVLPTPHCATTTSVWTGIDGSAQNSLGPFQFFEDAIASYQHLLPQVPNQTLPCHPDQELDIKHQTHDETLSYYETQTRLEALGSPMSDPDADNESPSGLGKCHDEDKHIGLFIEPFEYLPNDSSHDLGRHYQSMNKNSQVRTQQDRRPIEPVEHAKLATLVDDLHDLAFITISIPHGSTIISPSGQRVTFDGPHGEQVEGQREIHAFFFPELAKHLPNDFQPYLSDRVNFRVFLGEQTSLLLDNQRLSYLASPGEHHITEIDGELDLLHSEGCYRISNDMQPIRQPLDIEIPKSMPASLSDKIKKDAEETTSRYRKFLDDEEEREKLEDARLEEANKKELKKYTDKIAKRRLKEHLENLAAVKQQERQAAREAAALEDSLPLGRGNRARSRNVTYHGLDSLNEELDDVFEDGEA